jgi:FkbM family methyltransferase
VAGKVIFAFARCYPRAFVVQVGAHDGSVVDPLREELARRPWRGILVEPIPYIFDRLRARYGRNPRLILENVAIADVDGSRELYHVPETKDDALWGGYDALGSFRRDVVIKHTNLVPDIEKRLVATMVQTLTFDSLCAKHQVENIDVVQIDTEGYDLEVLKLIDFDRWKPALVMYEHAHLNAAEQAEARTMLERRGYRCVLDEMDTLAVLGSTLEREPELQRVWATLAQ